MSHLSPEQQQFVAHVSAQAAATVVLEHLTEEARAKVRNNRKLIYQQGILAAEIMKEYLSKVEEHMALVVPVENKLVT